MIHQMWTDKENRIISENHGKLTLPQIMKLLPSQHSYNSVRKHCQKMGLYRNHILVKLPFKYFHNTEYWKEPNLVNSTLAGIIASDGNIHYNKNGNSCSFRYYISTKDEQLVDLFVDQLQWTGKKKYTTRRAPKGHRDSKMVYICINSFHQNAEY